jgi:hypothetical protein
VKTPMREESLRIPTPTLLYLRSDYPKKGMLFTIELLRSSVQ